MDYGHLKLAAGISNGKIISPDTVLGTTYKWAYNASCYAVKTTAGVHTHVVLRNTTNYACWVKRSPGTSVNAGIRLGLVGGNFGGSSSRNLDRRPCPSNY